MLSDEQAKNLGHAIVAVVKERGIGAISKKDYELLVFHHLDSSTEIKGKWNYEVANVLKITESRVKSLRLEASIRHKQANHKAVLGQIVLKIIDEINKPEFSGGNVFLTLENPIERREFEYAVKLAKHSIEYGINREILKISPLTLFDVVLSNIDRHEERFAEIVQACIADTERQQEVLNNTLTFRQKINKLGEELSEKSGLVSLLGSASGML